MWRIPVDIGPYGVVMRTRARTTAIALLALVVVAMLVLTLSPTPFFHVAYAAIDRALTVLHAWGLPRIVNLHATELAANIAMFIPLGLLAAVLATRRPWWTIALGALVISVAIEAIQGALLPERTASLRDVLGNTAGAVVGIALTRIPRALVRARHAAPTQGRPSAR